MLLTELQTYSLTYQANQPFSSASSRDNSFSFITDKGIDVLELSPDPNSLSTSLSCRRYVIKPSPDLPTSHLGINPNDLLPQLDKEDAYTLITDTTASPRLLRTLSPNPAPRLALWSPVGILHNQRCVLAILTDVGSLCLYALINHEYTQLVNISSLWLKCCKDLWSDAGSNVSSKLAELRQRAGMVKLNAMCWLGEIQDETGWLATVSKSGLVALWKVKECGTDDSTLNLDVTKATHFDAGLSNATMMYWTTLSSGQSLLTLTSMDGRVHCFTLSPISSPSVVSSQELWSEQDRISTVHITSWEWQQGLALVVVKGAFVIVLRLDSEGQKLSHAAYRCCDTSVTGLSQLSDNEVMMVTRSSRFGRLTLSLTDDGKVKLTTADIESYINISHMGCYGLSLTSNSVICFILLSVNQSYDHLRLREASQVVVCSLGGRMEPQAVLENPHRPISRMWDCLELLRVQILQRLLVLDVSYPPIVLDNMDIDKLTVILWWATFATAAEENETKHHTLVKLRNEVEILVISCHFFRQIAIWLAAPIESLSGFQLQSLALLRNWLVKIQELPEEFSTTLITARTLLQQLKALEDQLPREELCSICGSVITNMSELFYSNCDAGHKLPRCSLSLVQCCQLPFYTCAQCGALAHSQAVKESGVTCNLCGGVLRIDEDIL